MEVLRKKKWCRIDGDYANRFEETWARMMGAKHCVAVANGTSALITSLAALGIGPGDEVLVPPYTFVATINAVLVHHALPVFVDTDPETFQIDARLLESSITEHTACILPVHIGGSAADMDAILAVAARHKLPVLEDACQAALARVEGPEAQHARRPGLLQLPGLEEPQLGRGRRDPHQRRPPGAGMPELPEQRPRHRRRAQLRPQRRQPPHDRVPGRAPADAAHPAGGAVPPPRAERRLPHRAAPRDPRHRPGAHVRRLHPERLSPLHVPL